MKFSFTLIAAAGLVAAQNFEGQPECAIPCLESAIPKVGCDLTDTACQCQPEKQASLGPIAASCLIPACPATDLIKAQTAAAAACSSFFATASDSAQVTVTTTRTTTSGGTVATITSTSTGASDANAATTGVSTTSSPAAGPTGPVAVAGFAMAAFLGAVALV